MCILEEQKSMTAAMFQKMANSPVNVAPKKGHSEDDLLERSFWSGITLNPPLYGADTPTSLFDPKIPFGWNLRNLGCLLKDYNVPKITGVTTPMTYFGMWKAFFAWHKEDLDLMSVNYLHMGAPKVWYCVAPSDAPKFDAMTRHLFPEAATACPAFMRHKDVVISPKVLKSHNVPFVQAKQKPGEFIVLNASAYHAGFNLGFNCAEAVNFALPSWMEIGRDCLNCECGALPDSVQLDMSLFFPGLYDSSSSEEESDSEDDEEQLDEEGSKGRDGQQSKSHKSPQSNQTKRPLLEESDRKGEKRRVRGGGDKITTPSGSSNKRARSGQHSPALVVRTPEARPASARTAGALPHEAIHVTWGDVEEPRPVALVDKDPDTKLLWFQMVHRLARPPTKAGGIWFGALREDEDDEMFRPSGEVRQVKFGLHYPKIVRVRTEWAKGEGKKRQGGWKLITTDKRILMN